MKNKLKKIGMTLLKVGFLFVTAKFIIEGLLIWFTDYQQDEWTVGLAFIGAGLYILDGYLTLRKKK